ncbi:hypothetical protein KY289_016309 [Solanum tuberosum]|nr:hypothetical protein KY289_016309 [Solanum tuberosum]
MNSAPPIGHSEGQSTIRPPMFKGSHFWWWKARMEDFIQAEDYELWDRITTGPTIPMKTVEGAKVQKVRVEFSYGDLMALRKNAKAKNILVCGLVTDEYNRISNCTTAKQLWDALVLTTEEQVDKVLRILPKTKWDVKVTTIREAKDISIMTLDELVGNLRTYEMNMDGLKKEEVFNDKSLALKVSDGEESDLDEDQIAFLAKSFNKYIKKGKESTRRKRVTRSGRMKNLSPAATSVERLITISKYVLNGK